MTPRSPAKPTPRRRLLAAALLLACVCSPQAQTVAPAPSANDAAIDPAHWPQPTWPLAEGPALEKRINDLLTTMTPEEKVGQIIQGDIASLTPDDRRVHEAPLVDRYVERLDARGVAVDRDVVWEAYRRHAFGGLVMAILASGLVRRTERWALWRSLFSQRDNIQVLQVGYYWPTLH